MTATISGKEYAIGKLFTPDFVFTVPPYQRPYAWGVEEAGILFDDLVRAMGDVPAGKLDAAPPYFLGSIVIIKPDGHARAEVVDGQQRLTTLSVLLAVLRAELPGDATKERAGITRLLYDEADPIAGTSNRYRLELRTRDAEFFRDRVQAEGALDKLDEINAPELPDSQQNLVSNARHLRLKVRGLAPERRSLLAQYIARRSFMVVVSTASFDDAYRIFSVLNDRGMDLSLADILKAEVLGAISREAERDAYALKWEEAEEELGRDSFKELFSFIRTIELKRAPEKSVLAEVREQVVKAYDAKTFVDKVVLPYADALTIALHGAYESAKDPTAINRLLGWLRRIDNVDWIPAALVVLSRYRGDAGALEGLLKGLDRLASVLMVGRADSYARMDRYTKVLTTLATSGVELASVVAAMEPTKEDLRGALQVIDGDLYLTKKVTSYVLLRLDAALADAGATYTPSTVSVEHVLPQGPPGGSQWLTWWPDEEQRVKWTHRLGNLLLLSRRKNSEAQNFDFDVKKERYFKSKTGVASFALTTQVLNEKMWTPEVVERRHGELRTKLSELWGLGFA